MKNPTGASEDGKRGQLSIGALSRATGVPIETLRTWERRYGYPVPERKPSGHRVYPVSSVPRLRRIAEALSHGHRAGDVVPASDADLSSLLDLAPGPVTTEGRPVRSEGGQDELFRAVSRFDSRRLTRILQADWSSFGPLDFLRDRVGPLLETVGEKWAEGSLGVRHEHFLAERVGDLLRAFRAPFEERARGPLMVCATLPGEAHELGLQMAALVLSLADCRVLYLGAEVPFEDMVTLGRDMAGRALVISVSRATQGASTGEQLDRLRRELPRRVTLVVGGAGAPEPKPGIERFESFEELHTWGRKQSGAS